MTQNANHIAELPAEEETPMAEGQRGHTSSWGVHSHTLHLQRLTRRDNVLQECDLSLLFSIPPENDPAPAITPQLTDTTSQGSSTTEDEWGRPTPEPTWGRYQPPNYEDDLKLWTTTNVSFSSSPTIYYRECEKCTSCILTSTKVFHSSSTFTCVSCLDGAQTSRQTLLIRNPDTHDTRDDEQEFGGIPIPTSDDSSDDFYFDDDLSSQPDENKSDTFINCMNRVLLPTNNDSSRIDTMATVDMAFTLAPVRDGIILHHTLSPIPFTRTPTRRYKS